MDPIALAKLMRANHTLNEVVGFAPDPARRSAAFVEIARSVALRHTDVDVTSLLKNSKNHETRLLVEKASPVTSLGDLQDMDSSEVAEAFAASLAPASVLDACLMFAKVLPVGLNRAMSASGSTGETDTEGNPRVVQSPGLTVAECPPHQVSAVLVFNKDVLLKGDAALQVFDTELRSAIARALNTEMWTQLDSSSTTTVATTGDAVKDLRAALAKADPATGYVYAAPGNTVATMATDPANRGAGVRGGEFAPGIFLVADDDIAEPTLIPASRLVLQDNGLRLEPPAQHASVSLAATPQSPGEMTSLWQVNAVGLIAFREWRMNADRCAIVKVTV
jgi:hypothetical protein